MVLAADWDIMLDLERLMENIQVAPDCQMIRLVDLECQPASSQAENLLHKSDCPINPRHFIFTVVLLVSWRYVIEVQPLYIAWANLKKQSQYTDLKVLDEGGTTMRRDQRAWHLF